MSNFPHPSTVSIDGVLQKRDNESIARLVSLFTQHTPPSLINTQRSRSQLRLMNSSTDVENEPCTPHATLAARELPLLNPARVLSANSKPREFGGAWQGRYSVRPVIYVRFGRSAANFDGCSKCRYEGALPLLSTNLSEDSSPCEVLSKALIPHPSRPSAPLPASYYRRDSTRMLDGSVGDGGEAHTRSVSCFHCSVCLRAIHPKQGESTERLRYQSPSGWIVFLERDECVARERIVEKWLEGLLTIPLPAHFKYSSPPPKGENIDPNGEFQNEQSEVALRRKGSGLPQVHLRCYSHPGLLLAIERLSGSEYIARRQLLDEEDERFNKQFKNLGCYLRYLAPNGSTTRTYGFLRAWIARHRAQKIIYPKQIEQLESRENAARQDLISGVHTEQQQLFKRLIETMETIDLVSMLYLQLLTSYSYGVISIRLAEQVARFPILFGCLMRDAGECARVFPHTIFYSLILENEHHRRLIEREEEQERFGLFIKERQQRIMQGEEQSGRKAIEEEEAAVYWKLARKVFLLQTYYSFRNVEQYEASTRDTEFHWEEEPLHE